MVSDAVKQRYGFGWLFFQVYVYYGGGNITIFTPLEPSVVLFYYCRGVLIPRRGYTDFTGGPTWCIIP